MLGVVSHLIPDHVRHVLKILLLLQVRLLSWVSPLSSPTLCAGVAALLVSCRKVLCVAGEAVWRNLVATDSTGFAGL